MIDNEHEALRVHIPDEIRPEDITDRERGYFRAEVSILRCDDCGHFEVTWRPFRTKGGQE